MLIPLTLLVATLVPVPQAVPVLNKDSDTVTLVFDQKLEAVDGTPVVLDAAEFVFKENPPTGAPVKPPFRVLKSMQPIVLGANAYRINDLLTTVPLGEYDVTVRVRDDTGAWSAESNVLHRRVISKKPATPTNLRESVVGS